MRSAVVTSSISRNAGGLFFAVRSLHQHLFLNGVSARVLALRDEFSREDAGLWAPLATEVHEVVGLRSLGYSPALGKTLATEAPDVVHVHGIWQGPSIASLLYCSKNRRPNVISPHGMLDPWAYRNARWKKRLAGVLFEFRHLKTASCLIALCQSEARSMRDFGLTGPIAIVPNGVELPEAGDQRSEVRDQKKTLLFLGRLHPKKGLVNALRAWSVASRNLKAEEWRFVIAGWDQGGHEEELKQQCREFGVSVAITPMDQFLGETRPARDPDAPASVLFVGPAFGEKKDALFRSADAFILPSFSEGLPMSVLEAWSYALPVLMTDHCNLPEGFEADAAIRIGTGANEQEAGDRESAMPIEEGLRALFEMSDSDRRAMGHCGRQLVEHRFTWPQIAAQMKAVYEWVLGGGPKPNCVMD